MSNLPPPVPSTHQVPDARFQEINQRLRQAEEQNAQLRGQIDLISRRPQSGQAPSEPIFKPDVDQALNQKFQALIQPIQQQFQQTTGMMVDRVDRAEFESRYVNSQYTPYVSKVEEIMHRNQAQGKWIPREEILKHMYWEENGRKVQEPAAKVVEAPKQVYDPYLGQWKDTATGEAVAAPAQQVIPPGELPQSAPPPATPLATPAATPVATPQQPNGQWVPQLASSQPPPAAPAAQPTVITGLTLESDARTLSAWKDKYGDQPF